MKTKLNTILEELEKFESFPNLKCPFCEKGILKVDDKEKIEYTNVSSEKYYDLVGEPTDLVGEYSYLLLCDNLDCGEKGMVIGKTNTIEDGYDDGIDQETGEEIHHGFPTYKSKYKIEYISVPVQLIDIPDNIEPELKSCIESSFILFWVDLNSCGNRIRSFVELLLNHINVPKKSKLDQRIKHLENDTSNPHNLLAKNLWQLNT